MKTSYIKTKWVDNKTPVNAKNLNKIEEALGDLYENAIGKDEIVGGTGIDIDTDEEGQKVLGVSDSVMMSNTCSGFEFIEDELPNNYDRNKIYFILDSETKTLIKIMLNGITIFEV